MPFALLLTLFFASGACGLVYQIVWMRVLSLTFSVTVYAVTTVLCAFMGGLAVGAAIGGRVADRLRRPLLAFGLVELGVGAAGLAAPAVLFGLGGAYVWLHGHLGGAGLAFPVARFLLASAVLLLPCTLMGMTLPLLSRAAIGHEDAVGRGAGALYAVNTLGAVAGCIAAGFVLIPRLGLHTTSAVAAAINGAVGLTAVALGGRTAPAGEPAVLADRPPSVRVPAGATLAALAFAVSGFTAIGYEVLWTRALQQFTHNSTYAYTAMLATFLFGLGAGSAAAATVADRAPRPLALLGLLELAIGLSVIGALLIYVRLLDWIPAASATLGGLRSWPRVVALIFGIAGTTLLTTTLLFGATFPFVARAVVASVQAVGRQIAVAYTLNTVGAILGAVAVGLVILPLAGLRASFLLLLATNLALGAGLIVAAASRRAGGVAVGCAVAGVAVAVAVLPPGLFEQLFRERFGKLLMYREEVTDTVMVTEDARGGRLIRYGDGRGTAGTATVHEDRSYAHLAMLLHPDPRRVLSICFGVGNSLSAVAQYPVERVDAVELSPGVVYAAPFFRRTNRDVLKDPRVHLTIQDGRNYLLESRERYDVIRLDPPELHTAGVVNLYTKEFFALARDHLAPGGIFSLWINIAYTPEPELRMIARTMAEVFPHVTVWHGPFLYSWVMNGSMAPRPPDAGLLARWFTDVRVRADLATIGVRDPLEVLKFFVMAGDEVGAYAGDAPVITDDHTRVDFTVPRSVDSFFGISNSITDYWLVDLIDPRANVLGKAARMCRHKRPVLPHLLHAEAFGLDPVAIGARLDALLGSLPGGCGRLARAGAAGRSG